MIDYDQDETSSIEEMSCENWLIRMYQKIAYIMNSITTVTFLFRIM